MKGSYMNDGKITQLLVTKLLLTEKPEQLTLKPKCFNDINFTVFLR